MRKSIVLACALLITGCTSAQVHVLDAKWRPLEEIHERPSFANHFVSGTAITTVGRYAYVKNLTEWLARVPVGTAKYEAILRHEQEHSKRQLAAGTGAWVARYAIDKEFALLEEQIGYFYEIAERVRLGDRVVPEAYALVLSKYKILTGSLISYEDALDWVNEVLSGAWTPPN
jgi:hypothetical protein